MASLTVSHDSPLGDKKRVFNDAFFDEHTGVHARQEQSFGIGKQGAQAHVAGGLGHAYFRKQQVARDPVRFGPCRHRRIRRTHHIWRTGRPRRSHRTRHIRRCGSWRSWRSWRGVGRAVFKNKARSAGALSPGRAKGRGKAAQAQHVGAGLGDVHIHVVDLLYDRQGACLVGRYKRAPRDRRPADLSGHRGLDARVVKIDLRRFQRGACPGHARPGPAQFGLHVVQLLLAHGIGPGQHPDAGFAFLLGCGMHLGFLQFGLGGVSGCLVNGRVYLVKRLPPGYHRAFFKQALLNDAVHLRAHFGRDQSRHTTGQFAGQHKAFGRHGQVARLWRVGCWLILIAATGLQQAEAEQGGKGGEKSGVTGIRGFWGHGYRFLLRRARLDYMAGRLAVSLAFHGRVSHHKVWSNSRVKGDA